MFEAKKRTTYSVFGAYVQSEISKLYASKCLVTFKEKFLVLNPHTPI